MDGSAMSTLLARCEFVLYNMMETGTPSPVMNANNRLEISFTYHQCLTIKSLRNVNLLQ
jgi:hypothetical protein